MSTIGNVFVLSAPSGAGKSSLVRALCAKDQRIRLSISHTTRPPRTGEANGIDYYFTDVDTFKTMVQHNQFIEYAIIYDHMYGTSIMAIEQLRKEGFDIILEIDYQGAKQIRTIIPDAIFIFVLPPNKQELLRRLQGRNTDNPETILKRIATAETEISHAKEFDYVIVNDDFNLALDSLYSIISVQRLKSVNILANYHLE